MPIVNYQQYCQMLDNAKDNKFAYPAINTTSSETINAALLAFKEANSDGIIQVSTGGGKFASGLGVGSMAKGAIALATYAHLMAEEYDVNIALHTDHCHPEFVEPFLMPLIAETAKRRAAGLPNLFSSHMYDGSALPMDENIKESQRIMAECVANDIILEIETGIVGGEEDGHDTSNVSKDKLYTTPEDMVFAAKKLGSMGRFMLAATFGNVHGVYKPGNVKLTPSILKDGQEAVIKALGSEAHLDLVFHGGSGSELHEIHETLAYGVIKMNIDTDTQYAYTRPIVDHLMKNYDSVLKIEGEVGDKKVYDPRSYNKKAERSMADRIIQACEDLRSSGTSLGKNI
ncbi:MAG: fructose-bisphosphate aldolase class II [Cellvibrionaceae bacterium]|jgi:fructose-bisphosphate aldolase class II